MRNPFRKRHKGFIKSNIWECVACGEKMGEQWIEQHRWRCKNR